MHPKRLVLAGGVFLGLVFAVAAVGAVRQEAGQAAAGQPQFVNARVETKAAAPDLARAFGHAVAAQASPGWIGWAVPAVPGEHHGCESERPARAYLEGRPDRRVADERDQAAQQASSDIAVLFRVEAGRAQKVRVFGIECELEAGGLPVTWFTNVRGSESVALLEGLAAKEATASERFAQSALTALALHRDPSAQQALERFVGPTQPAALRKRAAFWLGAARGEAGFETLRRLVAAERDASFRRELVFPISLSRRAEAIDVLIRLAREDASPEVRKQAMFWLGNKAGERTASTLADATVNDPDTAVKRQAVFGLSRMPNGEGVPRLIEVARTNRNPEVRRQAMFWLGRSSDPRALAYLEEVLTK